MKQRKILFKTWSGVPSNFQNLFSSHREVGCVVIFAKSSLPVQNHPSVWTNSRCIVLKEDPVLLIVGEGCGWKSNIVLFMFVSFSLNIYRRIYLRIQFINRVLLCRTYPLVDIKLLKEIFFIKLADILWTWLEPSINGFSVRQYYLEASRESPCPCKYVCLFICHNKFRVWVCAHVHMCICKCVPIHSEINWNFKIKC